MRRPSGLGSRDAGLPSALTRLRRDRLSIVALTIVAALAVGAARTSEAAQLQLTGAVNDSWRGAYDILVRPAGAALELETTNGLIEPNFLDYGANGRGISLDDLAAIRAIRGVEVAAPVSVVGYVLSSDIAPDTVIASRPTHPTMYRLTLSVTTSDGQSTLPYSTESATVLVGGGAGLADGAITSMSGTGPDETGPVDLQWLPLPPIRSEVIAVDPSAEQALLGPRGSYLSPLAELPAYERGDLTAANFDCSLDAQALAILGTRGCAPSGGTKQAPLVPLVVADRLPASLVLHLSVSQVGQPLTAAPSASEVSSTDVRTLINRLLQSAGARLTPVGSTDRDVTALVRPFGSQDLRTAFPGTDLASSGVPVSNGSPADVSAIAPSRPAYVASNPRPGGDVPSLTLSPLSIVNADGEAFGPSSWIRAYALDPREYTVGSEPAYRALVTRPITAAKFYSPPGTGVSADVPYYADAVGTFDPAALAGADAAQDPLAYVPLGAYAAPETHVVAPAEGSNVQTGSALGPTLNPAGFVSAPPSAITDLLGATLLRGPNPIDAIRVRVAGLGGFDDLSRAKVQTVAAAIRAMGLEAEIVAGASPSPVEIYVAGYDPSSAGQKDLGYVSQQWTSLGAAQRVESGLGSTNLLLLVLSLVVAAAFAAGLASIKVASRTGEASILRAIGWSDGEIFRYLTADALVAGLVAEVAATAAAVTNGPGTLSGLLVAFLLAATLPAGAALATAVVLRRSRPSDRIGGETSGALSMAAVVSMRGPVSLGIRNALARPMRTIVTTTACSIGAAAMALGVMLVLLTSVGHSLLAVAMTASLGPFQALLLAFIAICAITLVLVLERLELRDRAPEFAVLSSAGWSPGDIRSMLMARRLLIALVAMPAAAALAYVAAIPVALVPPNWAAGIAAALALSSALWSATMRGGFTAARGASA